MQQVLKQLLDNALKYSPEGSPLTIRAELQHEKIVISVADRGPGIDEDERARIFDKFFRGRRDRFQTQGNRHGAGDRERHRGGARRANSGWTSEPGQGSVFSFSLPVLRRRTGFVSAGKILVVDDDPQIRRVMRATLSGPSVTKWWRRAMAKKRWRRFRQEMPDLVLLDMNMPGMDGLETCRSIRAGSEIADHHPLGAQHGAAIKWRRSTPAPTIMSPSLSAWRNCWRGSGPPCAARRLRPKADRTRFSGGDLEIDFDTRRVRVSGRDVRLTPKEFELLRHLVAHAGKPVTASRTPAGGLGPGLRRRARIPPRLHQSAPEEDRTGSRQAAVCPHRALGGYLCSK